MTFQNSDVAISLNVLLKEERIKKKKKTFFNSFIVVPELSFIQWIYSNYLNDSKEDSFPSSKGRAK